LLPLLLLLKVRDFRPGNAHGRYLKSQDQGVKTLRKRGYESMLFWYQEAAPHKFIPTLFPVV
jgi:hypothetical protein